MLPGAMAIALVGFAESVAAARAYATKYGYEVNANQELIALGVANVGAGISQGFTVDGSLSKSAAADEAGTKSQMTSIIVAGMVLITVVALTPLFYSLPEAALGAIVIHAVWHLIDLSKLQRYRRIKHVDFWAAVTALVGVLLLGILAGLLLAALLSLLGLLVQAKRAHNSILGKLPDEQGYHSLEYFPDAATFPGLIIFRFDEQLFFANSADFRNAVRAAISSDPSVRCVLVDAEGITDIDITGLDMLADLNKELAAAGISLRFAQVKSYVRELIRLSGLEEAVGAEHFYGSIQAGVDASLTTPPA
ncbi:MAG: STAS domain-containing protein [Caldilineaceae bacterium]|nr:STAS domain-containing protein [Caldilineaceae bacterium]